MLRHPKKRSGETTPLIVEQNLKNSFRLTSAALLSNTPTTDFDWLLLQQHYGVRTRQLDWTENPFIALYFPLSSSSQTEN
ncbi:FRG domain-containing protein, partial [Pseudomonas aeruginosa]|uniref:FRG domain-containing protein n=1 Tax=Pseudomonas aeruginosa TaxID=287 RepID=UPI003CC66DD8